TSFRAVDLRVEQVLRLVLGQERRQAPGQLRAPDLAGGIEFDDPAPCQVLEAAPHCGQLAGHRRSRQLALVQRGQPRAYGACVRVGHSAQLLTGQKGAEVSKVGGVASNRMTGGAALVIEIAEELGDRILHADRLTPPRERPLPGIRTLHARTGASVCRLWPRAPSRTGPRTSGTAPPRGAPKRRTCSRDTCCRRRMSSRACCAAPRAGRRSPARGTRCPG